MEAQEERHGKRIEWEKAAEAFARQAREAPRFVVRFILAALLLGWALLISFYFIYRNRHLFLVFASLFRPYNLDFAAFQYWDCLYAAVAICVYLLIGHLFLACFDLYLPRAADLALSYVFGLGLVTVVFELLTMAHLLYQPVAIVAAGIVLLAVLLAAVRHNASPVPGTSDVVDPRFFRRSQLYMAREKFQSSVISPKGFIPQVTFCAAAGLIGLITLLTFYHGVFFPVTYWDALILYVGYARKIFFAHAFPFKAVAQVGIGLGSNYPHLYPLMSASIATAVGHWSDLFAQLAPPFAGLLATFLVYQIVLRLSRNMLTAIAAALLFRVVPYGIRYFTYASDYAIAILFTTAFLYVALLYIERGLKNYFVLATLIPAFSVHINYLMWILWAPWLVMVIVAHTRSRRLRPYEEDKEEFDVAQVRPDYELDYTYVEQRKPLFAFIGSRHFLPTLIIALLLASPWYLRNWVLTGNPVYPFLASILDGVHINPEVLESCKAEWLANGDGIGKLGRTLGEKIRASWHYFVIWRNAWMLAPVFVGFTVPGVLIFIVQTIGRLLMGQKHPKLGRRIRVFDDSMKFGLVALTLLILLFIYHYAIASMYLYQIIIVLPLMAIFAYFVFERVAVIPLRGGLLSLCLLLGIVPGLAMGLMGFKFQKVVEIAGKQYDPLQLVAFRNPGMNRDLFLQLEFGGDVKMWDYINSHLLGEKILTHENRHLMFDESITLVHLDDWEIQATYHMTSDAKKMRLFKDMGIHYYLYVPMEDKHRINKRVGLDAWRTRPELMSEVFRAGGNVLYKLNWEFLSAEPRSEPASTLSSDSTSTR
jgi:hypothetical protein